MTDNPKVTALARADGFCSALGSHGKFAADSPRQIRDWISVLEQSIRRAEDSARAEALEEAAKVCDKPVDEPLVSRIPGYVLAERIRALKLSPARKAR